MKPLLFFAASLFALGSAAAEPFAFGVLGDVPYGPTEVTQLREMIEEMNREALVFVAHVGDLKDGHSPCTDEDLQARKRDFETSRHAFVYVPGDNEWTDCIRPEAGAHPPATRLARLREIFYPDHRSLGRAPLELVRQSNDPKFPAYRENMRWQLGDVLFITLNLTGSHNGWGQEPGNAEFFDRLRANTQWLAQAFTIAKSERLLALVVLMHANPEFGKRPDRGSRRRDGYAEFKAQLVAEATRFERPVLVVHGDSHRHRVDRPLIDFATGRAVDNVTRMETFGSPLNGWVKVIVDPGAAQPFRVEPRSYPPRPRNEREQLRR